MILKNTNPPFEITNWSFYHQLGISILSSLLENTFLEEMVRKGFLNVFLFFLETIPFVSNMFTQYIVNVLHLHSEGQGFSIQR